MLDDYLSDVAVLAGINETENDYEELNKWLNLEEDDYKNLDSSLTYGYLDKSLSNFIDEDADLYELGIVEEKYDDNEIIDKKEAKGILSRAINYQNNKEYNPHYDVTYQDNVIDDLTNSKVGDIIFDENDNKFYKIVEINNDHNIYEEAQFEEVYKQMDIEDSFDIDFSQAEIIPNGEEVQSNYVNNSYELLASKTHSFNSDGFRVSYTLNSSNISIHISKNENGLNYYGDVSLSNVKPTFKWVYDEENVKHAYFRVNFNSTEKLGVSTGKYNNYYLDFKDLDSKSFIKKLSNTVKAKEDELEASIPICTIKTSIPELPSVTLNLEVLVKIYASGKIELQLYNKHSLGFETKDGSFRIINDNERDFDVIASGSGKSVLGVNFSINGVGKRLADIEFDGGLRGELKATVHLYDEEGNMTSQNSDIAYSAISEIAKENNNVKVCGDVSFHWLLDIKLNTSKTLLYKYGLTKTISLLDEDNQVFGNLHHIEDGHFVLSCTRKNRNVTNNTSLSVSSNRISLDSYAEVISLNDNYEINIKSLPNGYSLSDLRYMSENSDVASVTNGSIIGNNLGSTKIKVYTSDNKYSAYINILVSSE